MKRFAITSLTILIVCAAWAGIVYAALDRGWGLRPIAEQGDTQAFMDVSASRSELQRHFEYVDALLDYPNPNERN